MLLFGVPVVMLFAFVDGGQQCLSCQDIQNINDCHDHLTCSDNEVCFLTSFSPHTGERKLYLGCGYPSICSNSNLHVGSDLFDEDGFHLICSVCCNDTRLCNKDIHCDNSSVIDTGSVDFLPRECEEIENVTTGINIIYPNGAPPAVPVYCFVDNDKAWTVIQRRTTGCLDFYRNWQAYKLGFGNIDGEYWLGNKHIHEITSHGRHALYVQLEDFDDNHGYAEYSAFNLGDERSRYQLFVTNYAGNVGDSLSRHSGMAFSTFDRDNDLSSSNMAVSRAGAWWYDNGYKSNLNGRYLRGFYKPNVVDYKGVNWDTWKGTNYSVKATKMMIRSY